MKALLQISIVLAVLAFTVPAEASNGTSSSGYNSWSQGATNSFRRGVKKLRRWRQRGNGGGWRNRGGNSRSVPEMDVTVAPLAGTLLLGLMAAGYERRRRIQIKQPELSLN